MPIINSMRPGGPLAQGRDNSGDPLRHVPYTPAMIDEAAQAVLEGLPASDASVLYEMWSRDTETEVARMLMRSQAEARLTSTFNKVSRMKHTIRNVHTDEEVRAITQMYGEFDITFENVNTHDHAMGASVRPMDRKLLTRNKPPGMPYKDIGGSILAHVERGDVDVKVIHPTFDDKDPVRKVLTSLRLKKIAAGHMLDDPSVPGGQRSVDMAKSVLDKTGEFLVEKTAQEDCSQAAFAVACHVYDIPLADWPKIMERGGTHVVDGCVHYSNKLLEQTEGVMGIVRQRFKIDAENDEILMGFEGSSASWYRHKWSEYMRYGVDQVLSTDNAVYSYKIISRKGDTIFYRILRVGENAKPDKFQYYDTPGVGMVEVDGFDLEKTRLKKRPVKKSHTFPQLLWERMVRDATMDIMKSGKPDVNALTATYRVASVNHTYNTVNPLPTAKVDQSQVTTLVAHAAIAAYAEVLLVDVQAKHMMKDQIEARERLGEGTLYKLMATTLTTLVGVAVLPLLPFKKLADGIDRLARDAMAEFLVTWRPVARVKQFKAVMFLGLKDADVHYCPNGQGPFVEHMSKRLHVDQLYQLAGDAELAKNLLDRCGQALPAALRAHYEKATRQGRKPAAVVSADAVSEPPSYHTDDPVKGEVDIEKFIPKEDENTKVKVERFSYGSTRTAHRLASIEEAIAETEAVTKKIESEMWSLYSKKFVGGMPAQRRLMESPEKFRNPDVWHVVNGVITDSVLGQKSFTHAALWLDHPRSDGQRLLTVSEEYVEVEQANGEMESRRHFTVGDPTFTGWGIVSDDTMIFNGPNVLKALRYALTLPHDYTIIMNQGGAGAGKTTSIVGAYCAGDAVVCPVRKSTDDTRDRLVEKVPDRKERQKMMRTMDSLLAMWERDAMRGMAALIMHGDEAYMTREGFWCAAAAILGVSVASTHGDEKQIPAVPRVDVSKIYLRLRPDIKITTYLVYRCKPTLMAIFAPAYDFTLRTPLKDDGASAKMVKHVSEYNIPSEGTVAVIVMYQAQKLEVAKLLKQVIRSARGRIEVMTTHESEGKTFDHSLIVNTEVRPRMSDPSYLWSKQEYVLVAASRARTTLVYAKYGAENDLLAQWMMAVNPMRIKAVQHVESAGTRLVEL